MADQAEKTPGVIASAGQPVKADFPGRTVTTQQPADNTADPAASAPDPSTATTATPEKPTTTQATTAPAPLNDDSIREYLKAQGIDYTSTEDLKKKLSSVPAPALSDEEIQKKNAAKEKRLLDIHISRGGTPESFVNMKTQSSMDPKELGEKKLISDLIKEGFPAESAATIAKRMHLQVSDEELEGLDAEEKEEIIKERTFGLKKLNSRGGIYKKIAEDYLADLEKEAIDQDNQQVLEKQYADNVSVAIKAFDRKQTIPLGKVDDKDLPAVPFEVPESVLTEIQKSIGSKAALEKTIFNSDGLPNLDYIIPHLIKSLSYDKAVKTAYLEGQTRQTQIIKSQFGEKPINPAGPAAGGNGVKGNFVAAGEPKYSKAPTRQ